MQEITQADREAANQLREILADLTGFWFRNDDDSPLCRALAAHRHQTEQGLLRRLAPASKDPIAAENRLGADPSARLQRRAVAQVERNVGRMEKPNGEVKAAR